MTRIRLQFTGKNKAIEAGANGIMINHMVLGLHILRMLAEDPSINVPIMPHGTIGGKLATREVEPLLRHVISLRALKLQWI